MAVKTFTLTKNLVGTQTITWAGLTAGDTGTPLEYAKFSDKTVQVVGTFGGTVTMQGSNDGTNWVTLTSNLGAALTFTAMGGGLVAENYRYIRPSAGSGVSSVTITAQITEC